MYTSNLFGLQLLPAINDYAISLSSAWFEKPIENNQDYADE